MAFWGSNTTPARCDVSQFRCTTTVNFQTHIATKQQKPTDLQGGLPNEKATWLVAAGVSGPKNDMNSMIPVLNAELEAQLAEFPNFNLTSAASSRGRGKFSTYAKDRWNKVPEDGLAHYAREFPELHNGAWTGGHTTHKEMVAGIERVVQDAMQTRIGFVEDSAPSAKLAGPERMNVTSFQFGDDDACGGQKKSADCFTYSSDEDSTPDCFFGICSPKEDSLPSVPFFELPVQGSMDVQRPTADATPDALWTYIRALEQNLGDVNTRLRAQVISNNSCQKKVNFQFAQIQQLEKSLKAACPKIADLQSRCEEDMSQRVGLSDKNRQLEEEVARLQEQIARLEPNATTFCQGRQDMMANVFDLADNPPVFTYKQVLTDESVLRKFQQHLNTLKVCKGVWKQYGHAYDNDWKKLKREFHFNTHRTEEQHEAVLYYDGAMLAAYLFGSFE